MSALGWNVIANRNVEASDHRFETLSPALSSPERPWVLFVGEDEQTLDGAARGFLSEKGGPQAPVLAPPDEVVLPVAVHRLGEPGLSGARALYLPRIDRGFFDTLATGSFSAASPLYLLPAIVRLASDGGGPLLVAATAVESELLGRASEVVDQRGLWSRVEIRRAPGPPAEPTPMQEVDVSEIDSAVASGASEAVLLGLGLRCREPKTRARLYHHAVDEAPESGVSHLFLASSWLERKKPAEAVAALEKAVELEPGLASAHYELGKARIQTDDMEGAIAAFRRTTELLPQYSSAWGNLGAALGETQDPDGAAKALRRAVELDPSNHALHSNLGVTSRDQGRLPEAEACFEKALELAPDFVFGYYNLAHVYFLQGRFEDAIRGFEKAQTMDRSRSPRQGLLLAVTRLASGDVEGAFRDYRDVFDGLKGQMKRDMRTVAEWDLKGLAQRAGVTPEVKQAAALLRSLV